MEELTAFRRQIERRCLMAAGAGELISLPVAGFDVFFFIGILAGTAVTILCFRLLIRSAGQMMADHSKKPVVGGYFLRMAIYGVGFWLCLHGGARCAVGCAIGFLTLHIAMMIRYGIESRLPGAPVNPLNSWTGEKQWRDLSEWDDDDDGWKTGR